jgi:hypothetical protein
MLSCWRISKPGALIGVTEGHDKHQFTSKYCHQHCREAVVSSFPIEYDDSIMMISTDALGIVSIGYMHVDTADEIEIDWVEQKPWQ